MSSRYVSKQSGITSWHSFSAGAHYDADNVAFGPLIGCDQHLVDPGAGFDWHGHRGVHIVSRVLSGTLRHEDSSGDVRLVPAGDFLVQSTGDGVRHTETNASNDEPLLFVQLTVLGSAGEPALEQTSDDVIVGSCRVEMCRSVPAHRPLFVLTLDSGEDLRLTQPGVVPSTVGSLLVVELSEF